MTMQISITNDDPARTAKVEVQEFSLERRTIACIETRTLAPGTGTTVYLHAARKVEITEDASATLPKPSTPQGAPHDG